MSEPEYERAQYYKGEVEPVVGMLGWSAQAIPIGDEGYCWVPIGAKNDAFLYGRVWIKKRFTASETVRAERDIIIANERLEVKEHTPVELSFELAVGGFQRVTENSPLPMRPYGSYPVTYVTVIATAAGNTVIHTPASGKKVRVHYFSYSNAHLADADVAMRFDTPASTAATNLRHRHYLALLGGNVNANLVAAAWEGTADEVLYAYLQAAYAGGVYFNVAYTEE